MIPLLSSLGSESQRFEFAAFPIAEVHNFVLSASQMRRSGCRRRPILLPLLLGPLPDLDPALFFLPEKFKGSLLFGF